MAGRLDWWVVGWLPGWALWLAAWVVAGWCLGVVAGWLPLGGRLAGRLSSHRWTGSPVRRLTSGAAHRWAGSPVGGVTGGPTQAASQPPTLREGGRERGR